MATETIAGLYELKNMIGAKVKIKSSPSFLYFSGDDINQPFTIKEVKFRVLEDGTFTTVFSLEEFEDQSVYFRADQLWIIDLCKTI